MVVLLLLLHHQYISQFSSNMIFMLEIVLFLR